MLFGGSQDKNGMFRRLFKALFSHLGDDTYLVNQTPDIINRVVRSGIQFVNIKRPRFVKRHARFALIACFNFRAQMKTIECFGKNPCTGGFAHTTRSAKKVGMSNVTGFNGVFEGIGHGRLADNRIEVNRPVLTG
jgi:hypothetical protein